MRYISLILLCLFLGCASPYIVEKDPSRQAMIEWMEEAKESHEFYVLHSQHCNRSTGTWEYNKMWVERYEWIISHLRKE